MSRVIDTEKEKYFLEVLKSLYFVIARDGTIVIRKNGKVTGREENFNVPNVNFPYEGKWYTITKLRAIWMAFYGPIPPGLVVTRKEKYKLISADNVELITESELSARAAITRDQGGDKCTFAKLSNKQVIALRKEYSEKPFVLTQRAKQLGINRATLSQALTGTTFKNISGAITLTPANAKKHDRKSETFLASERDRKRKYMQKRREAGTLTKRRPTPRPNRERPIKNLENPRVVYPPKSEEMLPVATPVNNVSKPQPILENQTVVKSKLLRPVERPKFKDPVPTRHVPVQTPAVSRTEKPVNRLDLIKQAAKKLEDKRTSSNLSAFKKFAIYHLRSLGYDNAEVSRLVQVEDLGLVENTYRAYDASQYLTERQQLLDKYGEESAMLAQIKIFEGNIDNG